MDQDLVAEYDADEPIQEDQDAEDQEEVGEGATKTIEPTMKTESAPKIKPKIMQFEEMS